MTASISGSKRRRGRGLMGPRVKPEDRDVELEPLGLRTSSGGPCDAAFIRTHRGQAPTYPPPPNLPPYSAHSFRAGGRRVGFGRGGGVPSGRGLTHRAAAKRRDFVHSGDPVGATPLGQESLGRTSDKRPAWTGCVELASASRSRPYKTPPRAGALSGSITTIKQTYNRPDCSRAPCSCPRRIAAGTRVLKSLYSSARLGEDAAPARMPPSRCKSVPVM